MNIGGFAVESVVARGGQATVYRGKARDGREVAIKVLARSRETDVLRFAREERLLKLLRDENGFVPLLESGSSPLGPYLAMPWLPGGSLQEKLRHGRLAVREALDLGRDLARALGRAHALGIVHRDVKPANVLFDGKGRALLTDLGLAKHYDPDQPGASQSFAVTGDGGGLIGSVGYMAPEQVRDARNAEPPADVFGLGALLYESLTGEPPFKGETVPDIVRKTLGRGGESVAPVARLRPETPPALAAVVEQMLERDPARRFPDGAAVAAALDLIARQQGRGRVRSVGLALALGCGVLLGAVAARARGPSPDDPRPSPTPDATSSGLAAVASRDLARPSPTPISAPSPAVRGPRVPAAYQALANAGHAVLRDVLGEPKSGHAGPVRSVALSPDEKRVFTVGDDGKLRAWDAATAREVGIVAVASATVVALAPDGTRAVARNRERALELVDLDSGRARPLEVEQASSHGLHFTADGRRLLARHRGGLVLLDLVTGEGRSVAVHGKPRGPVAVSPDGNRVAVALEEGDLEIADAATGEELQRFGRRSSGVSALAFRRGGQELVSGREDGALETWSVASGQRLAIVQVGHAVTALAAAEDGSQVHAGGDDGMLRTFAGDSLDAVSATELHHGAVRTIRLVRDRALTGGFDGTAKLVDLAGRRELAVYGSASGEVVALVVGKDGARVLTGQGDGSVVEWSCESGAAERRFAGDRSRGRGSVRPVLSPDARTAVVLREGTRALLDVASGQLHDLPLGASEAFRGAAFSHDGRTLYAASTQGLGSFDADTGHATGEVKDPGIAWVLGATRRGSVIALARDYTVRSWDVARGSSVALLGSTSVTFPAAVSPEGTRLLAPVRAEGASGLGTGPLVLWDLPSWARLRELKVDRPFPEDRLAFSPDGWLALTTSLDSVVRLWDLGEGRLLESFDLGACDDRPQGVGFAPDGSGFCVATARGVVLRFQLTGGEPR